MAALIDQEQITEQGDETSCERPQEGRPEIWYLKIPAYCDLGVFRARKNKRFIRSEKQWKFSIP